MNATTAITAPDEYPPEVEKYRSEEESLEESGEPLFSVETYFGECFYKAILNMLRKEI